MTHREVYYGWWIVAASFSILLVTVGVGLYAPPIFLVPLQDHFGWSRAAIAGGSAVAALTVGAISPLVGVVDRPVRLAEGHDRRRARDGMYLLPLRRDPVTLAALRPQRDRGHRNRVRRLAPQPDADLQLVRPDTGSGHGDRPGGNRLRRLRHASARRLPDHQVRLAYRLRHPRVSGSADRRHGGAGSGAKQARGHGAAPGRRSERLGGTRRRFDSRDPGRSGNRRAEPGGVHPNQRLLGPVSRPRPLELRLDVDHRSPSRLPDRSGIREDGRRRPFAGDRVQRRRTAELRDARRPLRQEGAHEPGIDPPRPGGALPLPGSLVRGATRLRDRFRPRDWAEARWWCHC